MPESLRQVDSQAAAVGTAIPASRAGRLRRLGRRPLAALGRQPPAVVLTAIAAGASALCAYYVLQLQGWVVMTDELLYVKLGLSVGDSPSIVPQLRGEPYHLYSQLYPVLIAPVLAIFDMPRAFDAAHIVNALIMASTAVPAYLLARAAAVPRLAGYLVAALSVAVPWMAMSAILWTEVAAYPAFAWALVGMQRAISDPSPRTDLLALGGMALALFARTQFLILLLVFPVAILLHELGWWLQGERRGAARPSLGALLRRVAVDHRVLLAAYAALAAGALALAVGSSVRAVLGTYSVTSQGELLPDGVLATAGRHVVAFGVGLGVVPLVAAAGWAVASLVRPSSRQRHALAVLALVLVPVLAVQVASFTIRFSGGFQDRYFFYVAPLVFVGMAACLLDGRRSWPGIVAAGVGFAVIADLLTFEPSSAPPQFASPAAAFWPVLEGRSYELGQLFSISDLSPVTVVQVGTLAAAAALAAGVVWIRRGAVLLLVTAVPVLVFCLAETRYVLDRASGSGASIPNAEPISGRDWIDDSVGASTVVGLVANPDRSFPTEAATWDIEFWNKAIRRSYSFEGGSTAAPFHAEELTLDQSTGRLAATDSTPSHMVMSSSDLRFRPQGRLVASGSGHVLYEITRPYWAEWTSSGFGELGRLPQEQASLRFFPGPNGQAREVKVIMSILSSPEIDPALSERSQMRRRYSLRFGDGMLAGALAPGASRALRFSLCVPADEDRQVRLRVGGSGFHGAAEGIEGAPIGIRLTGIDTSSEPLDGPTCPSP